MKICENLLHVSRQSALLQELSSTDSARVWNTAVQLSVIDQLEFTSKCCATVAARKWIHGAMESRMHVQVLLLRKTFATILKGQKITIIIRHN
jgi:hypothetical protein